MTVQFSVTSGGGHVSAVSVNTNSSGAASTSYTLGATAGTNTVVASVSGVTATATFTETGTQTTNNNPSQVIASSGNNQSGTAGTLLGLPLTATVKDSSGNPVANALVQFSVTSGAGTLTAASATTNASGDASVNYTLGSSSGANTIVASVAGVTATATFTETGTVVTTVGSPAQVIVSGGNNQSGTTGTTLPTALMATVEDANGNPVPNVTVQFTVTSGAGQVSATYVTTNASGDASVNYTLGALAGANTVVASVSGVSFTATFTGTGNQAAAQHNTYYVSKASGASDSNDGLAASYVSGTHGPWTTVSHAASTAIAGDVVLVAAGTYSGNVTIANSGNSSAPIRFYAASSSANPTITGTVVISGKQYVEVRGFTVVGAKTLPGNWQDMPAVVIDSPGTVVNQSVAWTSGRQTAVNTKYATYVNTANAFFSPYSEGFNLGSSSNLVIAQNTVSLHTIGILPGSGCSNITVDSNNCFHCYVGIENSGSGTALTTSTFSRNHCYQNLLHGMEVTGAATGITVSNNLCEYNALCHISVTSNVANCTISGNTARYGGYYAETMQYPGPSAIDLFSVGAGNVVDGNLAEYQIDVTNTDGSGFIADTSTSPITFTNNVSYRNQGRGICLTATNNNRVINNTLVQNGYQTTSATQGSGVVCGPSSTGNTIENNIFVGNHYANFYSESALSSHTVDYNLYDTSLPLVRDPSTFYSTLASLQSGGHEGHGINSTPNLVSTTTPDFHPASNSPAIGMANAGISPADDFSGATRTTPTDMGALKH